MPEIDWDAPVIVTLRRGDAAAVIQAIGYANNVSAEAESGAEEIAAALKPSTPRRSTVAEEILIGALYRICDKADRICSCFPVDEPLGGFAEEIRTIARSVLSDQTVPSYLSEEAVREKLLGEDARRANYQAGAREIKSAATFRSEEQWAIYQATVEASLSASSETGGAGVSCSWCSKQAKVGDEGWESYEGEDYCPDCYRDEVLGRGGERPDHLPHVGADQKQSPTPTSTQLSVSPDPEEAAIGERIRLRRLAAGLTVDQLAREAEVDVGVLKLVEEDPEVRVPDYVVSAVARVLGLREDTLRGITDDPQYTPEQEATIRRHEREDDEEERRRAEGDLEAERRQGPIAAPQPPRDTGEEPGREGGEDRG